MMKKSNIVLALFALIFCAGIANAQNFSKFDVVDNQGVKGLNGLAHRTGARIIDILVPENFNTSQVTVDYAMDGSSVLSGDMPVNFSSPQIVKTKKDASSADTEWTVTLKKVKPDYLPLFLDFSQNNLNTADWNETTKGWAWAAIDPAQTKVIRFGNLTATFIVAFSEAAETISYSLNKIGSDYGDALFHVYASADGEDWETLRTFDQENPLQTTATSYTDNLSDVIRYVKWVYTKRVLNVNLNNISVMPKEIEYPIEPEDPFKPDFNPPREIPGMQLVWNDEFNLNGKPNPANWSYENGFVRNEELQWYKSDNVRCKDGVLVIEARREQVQNPNYQEGSTDWKKNRQYAEYTSGSISTQRLQDFKYGTYEIRARIDTTLGSWPAIWGKGIAGSWPFCGEIDIMEFYRRSKDPKQPVILANLAWGHATNSNGTWNTGRFTLADIMGSDEAWVEKFHVWRMDWTQDSIKLYLDDRLLNEQALAKAINPSGSNPLEPFQQNFYLMLNLAVGSNGGDPSNSPFPLQYEVDYIRVYQEDPSGIKNTLQDGAIRIYPNPVVETLYLDTQDPIKHIKLIDLTGKLMLNQAYLGDAIHLQNIQTGIYYLQIELMDGQQYIQKIIKL